jgi:mono/diheme cytochrome c family protein
MRDSIRIGLCIVLSSLAWSASSEELGSYNGAELYKRFCASCHGENGNGEGPVAPILKVMVPDLRLIARRHGGKFPADQIQRIIDGRDIKIPHGTRAMPVWGYEFTAASSDANAQQTAELVGRLVKHISTLQKN